MMDPEIERMIDKKIKSYINIILSGQAGVNDEISESINNLFPGMPTMLERPLAHPYGFCSRATEGTIQVTARQGDNPGNRLVVSHRAKDRPKDLKVGESVLYSFGKWKIYARNDKIQIGKDDDLETLVLGDSLVEFLTSFLDYIIAHTHAAPGAPASNVSDFITLKTNVSSILSED